MLRIVRIAAFLFFFLPASLSASYAAEWSKTYGSANELSSATSIQQTPDGGYVVAGWMAPGDLAVLKLNSVGTINWQKYYGVTEYGSNAHSIQQTADGGYIAAGVAVTRRNTSPYPRDYDVWVLKLNSDGTVAWQKIYGSEDKDAIAYSIQQTSDGGYIVAAERGNVGEFYNEVWVLKLKSDGTVAWQKTYVNNCSSVPSIRQTSDGGYVVAGKIRHSEGNQNVWVLKLNSDGTIAWQKTYGGANQYSTANSIQQTSDGGYVVTVNAWYYVLVLKLNSDGTIAWQKTYKSENITFAHSMQQTSDGGYVVAGYGASRFPYYVYDVWNMWVLKLNSDGTVAWQKTYASEDKNSIAYSIQQTSDGGYVVAGETSPRGTLDYSAWVLKLDANGNIPLCSVVHTSPVDVNDASTIPITTSATLTDTTVSPQTPANMLIDTNLTAMTVCSANERIIPPTDFRWGDWMKNLIKCMKRPGGVGGGMPTGMPQRCQPGGCPDCRFQFSQYKPPDKIPPYLYTLYRETYPFLFQEVNPKISESTAGRILKLLDTIPVGPHFTDKIKTALKNELRNSKTLTTRVSNLLAEAINAIELDLSVPSLSPVGVGAGKYSAIDLEGVTWLAFRNLKKTGKASVRILNGLPASAPGFIPVWPMSSYQFDFTGMLDKNGYIDISFYIGGMAILGRASALRVFEWDGKSYRDITAGIDLRRGIVTGRTNRLFTYVIMTPNLETK